jgi:hypothetical protein
MSTYQLKTFADLVAAVREEIGVQSTDTTIVNRIKRDINIAYQEIVAKKRWNWMVGQVDIQLPAYVNTGAASIVTGSSLVTLTSAPPSSVAGKMFAIDSYGENYRIESHTAGSLTLKLANEWTGTNQTGASFKIWADRLALPTDCKEVTNVYHEYSSVPLTKVGRDELRRLMGPAPRAEYTPSYFYMGEKVDSSPTLAIASLPAVSNRKSDGVIKQVQFVSTVPTSISDKVTAGEVVRIRISRAGAPSYNGDFTVSAVSTTTIANDTLVFVGPVELQEALTVDATLSVLAISNEADFRSYHELLIYPALNSSRITLHLDYEREAFPLDLDSDEPVIPYNDRVVLMYGALARTCRKSGNPEDAAANSQLYMDKLAQMAGKLQESMDKPRLQPSRSYLSAKRSIGTSRLFETGLPSSGPGGSGGATNLVDANISATAAIALSKLAALNVGIVPVTDGAGKLTSSTTTTTVLSYLDATSSIQTQLNSKQASGTYIASLTGDVTAIGPGAAAASVVQVGGASAANVASGAGLANAATSANTISTIVKRDGSGNFSAGTITAALTGNATTATSATTAGSFTGALAGDVTGTQSATAIAASTVTGKALTGFSSGAGTVSAADTLLSAVNKLDGNTALKAPTASPTFTGTVTAPTFSGALSGNATTATAATSFSGSLSGDVTGTQAATAISAATVTGKAITGFVSGAGTVTATDTVLTAFNKHDGNIALKAPIASPTFTGTVTAPTFAGAITGNVTGNASGSAASFTGTLVGDVGGTQGATAIGTNVVTNAQRAQMATKTLKGNNTGATANEADLTVAQVNAILPVFTSTLNGLAPLSGGGTSNYLRADGTWATVTAATFTNSMVRLAPATGFGSTNTRIRTYTATPITTTGTDITYTSSATNGDSWVVNTTGVYSVTCVDEGNTGAPTFGITLNSTDYASDLYLVAAANRLVMTTVGSGNTRAAISWTGLLTAADTIRVHTNNGVATFINTSSVSTFTIVRVH